MATLTWKDNRLGADDVAPWDTTVMLVGRTTPLKEMVSDSVAWCEEHATGGRDLMIYCHGSPAYLQLCKERDYAWNLNEFAPLKPYIDSVSIHACLVAKGQAGRSFCARLALVLNAPITGAIELQYNTGPYTIYGYIDDRKYDGDYYVHEPSGARTGPLRAR
jgi:hypothetical protein